MVHTVALWVFREEGVRVLSEERIWRRRFFFSFFISSLLELDSGGGLVVEVVEGLALEVCILDNCIFRGGCVVERGAGGRVKLTILAV